MNKFLQHPKWPTRNAHSHHVKEMFGLRPEQKWPSEGLPARTIQGIVVWVEPLLLGRGKMHRVRALCPQCQHEMSAGRLHQHVCVK